MGKAQYKRRIRSARHHANGAPITPQDLPNPSTPVDQEVVTKSKNKKPKNQSQQNERQATIAVLDKISSPASHDRIWSLAAMSNLVLSSATTRQLFLSKNLIRLLINRLVEDADQEDVLVEVTGVLRNLVIEGGRDVCGEMANKGILQPLGILVSKLVASIDNFQGTNENDAQNTPLQSLNWSRLVLITENVVIILWSLAETSSKWLDSVTALQDIIPLLSTTLRLFVDHLKHPSARSTPSRYVIPSSCALASGQCLYALTEDHAKLSKRLAFPNETSIEPLITLFSSDDEKIEHFSPEETENLELLRVVSTGILRNIILHTRKRADDLSFKLPYDEKMPHILIAKLQVDLGQLAAEAAEAHSSISQPTAPLSDLNLSKASIQGPSPAELKIESIERRLTLVQLALELVGEWCASADGFDGEDSNCSIASDGDDPSEVDEMEDSNDGSENPDDEESSPSGDEDVDMEEIPAVSARSKTNGIRSDHPSNEYKSNAMDIEESEPFVQSPQSTPFSHLLKHLNNLSKPTPYLYQTRESEPLGKTIIPTAMDTDGVTSDPLAGIVPDLISELLSGIHLRATDALNNMMITIDRLEGTTTQSEKNFVSSNQESLRAVWKSCWSTTSELAHHAHLSRKGKQKAPMPSQQCHREELLISALTCFWSLTRVLLGAVNSSSILQVAPDQTQCLIEILRTSENETLKGRALTTLTCLASRPNVSIEENAVIGDVLINSISKASITGSDIPNSLLVGALDGVFDVYADETRDYDEPVFRQRGFLETIKAAVPTIQAIVKKIDKRKDPALRQQAEAVQSNLSAFIDYRKSLM
ncbi:hypothetical protein MJO28_013756 [Puccinia striiformis f. sp. tritici]|uniref:Uncharacterized protein n=1 Tax=Puccinia striiformis f. sp. tritici TaxID=168172 RepID=A0ACC0DVN3_9BASI|nr:hypothetical protein MJO28_013756 [Puccinia striiformis f. sp. tritici]